MLLWDNETPVYYKLPVYDHFKTPHRSLYLSNIFCLFLSNYLLIYSTGFNRFGREYGLSSAQDFNPCNRYIACNRSDPLAYLNYLIHCQESIPEELLIPYHHHVHDMAINFLPYLPPLFKLSLDLSFKLFCKIVSAEKVSSLFYRNVIKQFI
jgi:hypothetical protein